MGRGTAGGCALSAEHITPGGDGAGEIQITKTRKKTQGIPSSLTLRRQVVPTSRPGALLPCLPSLTFLESGFHTLPTSGLALRALIFLLYVPPGHEPFDCFKDAPVPLARVFCCMDPRYVFNSKLPWETFCGTFGRSQNAEVVSQGF